MNIPKVNSERWLSLEDLEGEVWKDIQGYTGLYMISNYGRVKALEKYVHIGNYKHKYKEIIKREYFVRCGYLCVSLSKERKRKAFYVHRLVALAFLKNPSNLPTAYVIKNSTSVDYKQTTANFRRISYIRYRPFELKSDRGKP